MLLQSTALGCGLRQQHCVKFIPDFFMHLFDQANVIAYHRQSAAPATPAHRLQGWRDLASQQIRFAQLLRLAPHDDSLVLDIGCGLGDFYSYLQQHAKARGVHYLGIDLQDDFISRAQQVYAHEASAQFVRADFSQAHMPSADYVYASGLFCYPSREPDYFLAAIAKLYGIARRGLAFNMLDQAKFDGGDFLVTHSRQKILDYCSSLCGTMELHHDYGLEDFTVIMRRLA